jgi:uncharacterized protein with HEPN domain
MSARRDYTDALRDILEYADKAERFIVGIDFQAFQSNEEKTLAVIRALEVIGEAAIRRPHRGPLFRYRRTSAP